VSDFIAELKRRNVLRIGAAYLVFGWLVLQFIDVVFPMFDIDEALGRPILALLIVGLPVAIILAWVFEITPDGIKKEKDVDRTQSVTDQTGRLLDRVVIVILIFAVGLLLYDKFYLQDPAETEIVAEGPLLDSVAVLPFVNLSGKDENEYFSNGLTETLLHMLAQLPDLKVAARTSSFAFKDKDVDVREIGASLGVATVLEGSVQRSANTVRITAQLIEVETGFHLWSETFDRDLDDIFSVQDEIASNVAGALRVTLLGASVANSGHTVSLATNNAGAYEKFLMALEQKNIASYGSLPLAEGLFKEALSLDPNFCEATVELAFTYGLQAETGLLSNDEAEARIRPLLNQALELRPNNGRTLGLLAAWDWRNAVQAYGPVSEQTALAEADILRAIDLAPNDPDLYVAMANVAVVANRNEESLDWIDKGLDVDPLSARLQLQRGRILLGPLERPADALEAFKKGREISPEWTAATFAAGDASFALNRFADGISWYLRAMTLDPQDHELPASISRFYYQIGLMDEGDAMLRRAQALAPQEPWTRGLELERQLRADNYERSVILAEGIIRDEVDNRGNAFNIAVTGYVSSMIELGKANDVVDFFESLKPGISSGDYVPPGFNEIVIQVSLIQALVSMGSFDHANLLLNHLMSFADRAVPGWRDNDYTMANVSLMLGDRDTAIDYVLKDLNQPLGRQMNWRFNYQHIAWLKPLLREDRVAARVAELEIETDTAGDEVRAMLAANTNL
jgi:TolB-like protein/tetratricopeptide (TPR) repeat protein